MSEQNPDYATIQRNVEKGLSRQKWVYRIVFFVTHVLFFLVAMLAVWGFVATNSDLRAALFDSESGAAIIVILPTILWAAVILFHVASLFYESSEGEKAIRERLLMREIGEDFLRKGFLDEGLMEKPKRHDEVRETRRMMLSDDGELMSEDEDQRIEQSDYPARANHTGSSQR